MNDFPQQLQFKMDKFVHLVYGATKTFPKDEIYGATSQLRRAALSVVLNFIEGFARQRNAVKKNFWEISYGSLKESRYLLNFSLVEKYGDESKINEALLLSDEIGAMLWKCLQSLK